MRHPFSDASPVFMTAGATAGIGCSALPHMCVARKPRRRHGPNLCFLTARTWTGNRTIDLRAITQVRTWKEVDRGSSTTYILMTDASGVRLSFSDSADHRLIRQIVERRRKESGSSPLHVSRLALADLRIKPLPRPLSGLRSFLALERTCLLIIRPMMISAALTSQHFPWT